MMVKKNSNKVYFIAEAGINHNGSLKDALKMVTTAKRAGADCIKFQAFSIKKLLSDNTKSAEYQLKNTGKLSQNKILSNLSLNKKEFREIFKKCIQQRIEFLCTAFDEEWLKFLISLGMKKIKISSGEITNYPYLKIVAKSRLPIILSTGMSNMQEIESSINFIRKHNNKALINVLHCTSLYPAPLESLNLSAIFSIKNKFKLNVGYSDHSKGNIAAIASVAMGARIIEKHFTLDKNLYGPDQIASASPEELRNLVSKIRELEIAIGHGKKEPNNQEKNTLNVVRRSWHARRNIKKGAILDKEDVILLRPGTGILGNKNIMGSKVLKNIKAGSLIKFKWLLQT